MTIVKSPFQLSVRPDEGVKERIINALYDTRGIVTMASPHSKTLIKRGHCVSLSDLVRALDRAEVHDVRVVNYGMKALWGTFQSRERVYMSHPWARLNTFDIGLMFDMGAHIPLLSAGNVADGKTFPMLGILGRGYGSVNFTVQGLVVKCYPRLVHSLKAYAPNMSAKMPKSVKGLMSRLETLTGLKRWMHRNSDRLGGLRIEVRVEARCISEAVQRVHASRLLELEIIEEMLGPQAVGTVTVAAYLDNLERIWGAARTQVFTGGRNENKVPSTIRKKFRDLLNNFGWNPGWFGRKTPVTTAAGAWWLNGPAAAPFNGQDDEVSIELLYAQWKHRLGCLCGRSKFHEIGGPGRFRLRCAGAPACTKCYGPEVVRDMIQDLMNQHGPLPAPTAQDERDAAAAKVEIDRRVDFHYDGGQESWWWNNRRGNRARLGMTFATKEACASHLWVTHGVNWTRFVRLERP
jgi:hypothetical protein